MLKFKKKIIVVLKVSLAFFVLLIGLNIFFPIKINIDYSKIVLDSKGDVLYAFLTKDDKWRMFTELDEISPELKTAIIYKEDKYFYWHFGVNPIAIGRAFWNNTIKNKRTSGASTITMQVARMLYPKNRTYSNKIIEIFRAIQLEWRFSKDEILQLYLNLVPYGGNIEGVKSASVLYLEKQPNHLSLAEITALSIIPNRPTSLLPGKNNELIIQERNKWLKRFLADKVFEKSTIEDALGENFNATRNESPKTAPHFSFRMKNKFHDDINIETNLNSSIQKKAKGVLNSFMRTYVGQNINNASVIIIENKTMNVVGYLGSNNFYDEKNAGQVDGVNAVRQPGSTLKPMLYGLAIDDGILAPKTIISDVPINYNGYAPVNYDKKYNGYVTTEYALANSLNVPAVKILNEVGVNSFVSKLISCDFKSIARQKDFLGLSVVLGGCGTTLEELTTLFAAFANNGEFQKLNWLRETQNNEQEVVGQDVVGQKTNNRNSHKTNNRNSQKTNNRNSQKTNSRDKSKTKNQKPKTKNQEPQTTNQKPRTTNQILSPESNFMISEMMTNLERPDLPDFWRNTKNLPKIAWKTGTSYGRKDAWAIGFNDKYTIGVWVGNFSGEGVPEMTGARNATPILFNIFKQIDSEHSRSWLKKPKDLDIRSVCSASGMKSSEKCENEIFDYFIPLVTNNMTCTHLSKVYLSENDSVSYCLDCLPQSGYKTKWLQRHSPEIISFFESEGIGYEKIPPHYAKCEHVYQKGAPVIISPRDGSVYYIDKNYPEEIMLQSQVGQDASKLFWYVNDVFYKETKKNEVIFFKPNEGRVKISCSDDLGRNTNIWCDVEYIAL